MDNNLPSLTDDFICEPPEQRCRLVNSESDWFTFKEAIALINVSPSGFYKLVKRKDDLISSYIKRLSLRGKRVQSCISKEGLLVLGFLKGNNQHNLQSEHHVQTKKKEVIEKHIKLSKMTPLQIMQAQLGEMVKLEERQNQTAQRTTVVENKVDRIEERLKVIPKIHEWQRKTLNTLVRNFAREKDMPHAILWSTLHNSIGKESIDTYTVEDYEVAFNIMKKWYNEIGLQM